ncbi:non-ribosomal peptide synthetase [Streptomyces pini]|uniref:Amino acid adenylation domain-containing protein n=1 Tax=Streptomyces pini TaxID=1520580 RepID=A0A1I4GSB1_9ACTN|nr:non-ribosomal peptide synthetase [Streptomyces pini]SFL32914.1 amino acid adenylation domain-containing protein [Streptomyces pini]
MGHVDPSGPPRPGSRRAALESRLREAARSGAARTRTRTVEPVRGRRTASFAQRRMLFLDELHPAATNYHVPLPLRVDGPLDADALEEALRELERRHEVLRTVYRREGTEEIQEVRPVSFRLEREHRPEITPREVNDRIVAELHRPFDLRRGPVWRGLLISGGDGRGSGGEHHLLLTFHHIAFDGWSVGVTQRELSALYHGDPVPELPVQYGDYAVWQRRHADAGGHRASLEHWRDRLDGAPARLDLPADRPRPAEPTGAGGCVRTSLDPGLAEAVRALAQERSATPFMVLLAAFHALLARYAGQDDILVGVPVAGRLLPEVEPLVGVFTNTVVIRAEDVGRRSFGGLVDHVRERTLEALAHQDVPFEQVVEALAPDRDPSTPPVFQVMFNWNNTPREPVRLGAATMTELPCQDLGTSRFDLLLDVDEQGGEVTLEFEYGRDLFDEATVTRTAGHYLRLLTAAVKDPGRPVDRLPLLTDTERERLTTGWQGRPTGYPGPGDLVALIEERAVRSPRALALVHRDQRLDHAELHRRANRLAHHLIAAGARPDHPVAVLLERSAELVITLLAVLKSGAPYLPLDPEHPPHRLAAVITGADVELAVTTGALAPALAGTPARTVVLDEDAEAARVAARPDTPPGVRPHPDHLAYVIHTSGSTGAPKGVMVSHRAIRNRLLWAQQEYGLTPDDVVLQKTVATFDVSVWEFFWPLLAGACLAVAEPGRHRDPAHLRELILSAEVTTVHFVPSMLREFLRDPLSAHCTGLRRVLCSGETLPADLRAAFFARFGGGPQGRPELHNLYGPTEAAVDVTAQRCAPDEDGHAVPIGRPVANTTCHVLDRHGEPQPVGVPGELHLGGVQIARGYLGRSDLTAERFVPDPLGLPGGRLYRTGDLARWRPDGTLEFLGRVDHQVKVRGIRIEPGEIEATLAEHPATDQVVVTADRAGEAGTRLVAHLTPADPVSPPDPGALRAWLRLRLPEPMVPSAFVVLDAFPLSANGKVDRRRLPAPDSDSHRRGAYEPPAGPVETALAARWAELLGVPGVGRHDDFFALGGHSLLAARMVAELGEELGIEIPLRLVFDAPTVAELGTRVAGSNTGSDGMTGGDTAGAALPPVLVTDDPVPEPSFAEARLWLVEQLAPGDPSYTVPEAYRLRGPLDADILARALDLLMERHEALRTRYHDRDGTPVPEVAAPEPVELRGRDLSGLAAAEREAALRDELRRAAGHRFDLRTGPLLAATLVRLAEDDHVLALTAHHIAVDARSVRLLVRDLDRIYRALLDGPDVPLPAPPPVRYRDFARWQRALVSGGALGRDLAYWRDRLDGAPALDLPADHPRSAAPSTAGAVHAFTLPRAVSDGLADLAAKTGCTPFMVLTAAYAALLRRYTGQDDIVLTTPVIDRPRPELADVVGMFLNTLPLRVRVPRVTAFRELCREVRETLLGAFAHRRLPFDRMVDELGLDAEALGRHTITLERREEGTATLGPHVGLTELPPSAAHAKAELNLTLEEGRDGVRGWFLYRTDLHEHDRIARMARHFRTLLAAAVRNPDTPVHRLAMLTPAERESLLAAGAPSAPSAACLHDLIALRAARTPDATALDGPDGTLTYRQVEERANRLAHHLRALGTGRGDVVAVALPRSAGLAVALLAVLKSGATAVPLDLTYPAARLDLLLADSRARRLVTGGTPDGDGGAPDAFGSFDGVRVDLADPATRALIAGRPAAPPDTGTTPADTAFVFYTSGSTGRPKGVLAHHAGAVAHLDHMVRAYGVGTADTVLQLAPVSFDASVRDLFGPLTAGARVVLPSDDQATDPGAIAGLIAVEDVTCLLSVVPTMLRAVLAELEDRPGPAPGVRLVLLSGETLDHDDAARARRAFAPDTQVVNQYGPTECTMTSTRHRVPPAAPDGPAGTGPVPAGRPVPGCRIALVDADGELVPVGVPGEVWISGTGLTHGYLDRPDLTAERFVPDPFGDVPGARAYRTGDLARWRADGELEFLGRLDGQLKIRGNRVEPAEVESALRALPGVADAAVLAHRGRLAAWLAPAGLDLPRLRRALRDTLPAHLVPSWLTALPELPRTPNNKLDRRALPEPGATEGSAADAADAVGRPAVSPPRTPTESAVAALFAELLDDGSPFGRDDDFFGRGGHSLLAARLAARIRRTLGVDLPLRTVFDAPDVAALAARIDERRSSARGVAVDGPVTDVPGTNRPIPQQDDTWRRCARHPGTAAYNLGFTLRLTGPLDTTALLRALDAVHARHPALRTRFPGDADGVVRCLRDPVRPFPLEHRDVSGEDDPGDAGARIAAAVLRAPFDLRGGPLTRATLVRRSPGDHVLAFAVHHIVSDGWSVSLIERDLAAYYRHLVSGEPLDLPDVPGFEPYAARLLARLEEPGTARRLAQRAARLEGLPEAPEAPTDRPRPAEPAMDGATVPFDLGPGTARAVRQLARAEGASTFMVLFAAYQSWLHRLTGAPRFAVAVPVSNRPDPVAEDVVGPFADIVPVAADLRVPADFRALVRAVRAECLTAWEYQDLPYEVLTERVAPCRTMFAVQNYPSGAVWPHGLTAEDVAVDRDTCRYDFQVRCHETGEGISGWIEYSTELFDRDTVRGWPDGLREVLAAALENPGARPWEGGEDRTSEGGR